MPFDLHNTYIKIKGKLIMIKRNNHSLVLLALLVLLIFKSCNPVSSDGREKEQLATPTPTPEDKDNILKTENLIISPISNGKHITTEDTEAKFWFNVTFGELNLQNDVLALKDKNPEMYNKLINFIHSLEIEYYLQNDSDNNKATITLFPSRSETVNQIITKIYTPSINIKSQGNFTAGDTLPIVVSLKGTWEDKLIVSNSLLIEPILSSIYYIYTGVDKDQGIMKVSEERSVLLSVRNGDNIHSYYSTKITDIKADRNFMNIHTYSVLDDSGAKRFILLAKQKGETSITFSVVIDNNVTLEKTLNIIAN